MEEVWKDIKHYEDYYEVSSLGRVRVKQTRCGGWGNSRWSETAGDILLQIDNGRGYQKVYLHKSDTHKSKGEYVHRLVAMAFIPNPENKPQVDHVDCCRANNEVTNLRWVTQKENAHNELTYQKRLDRYKDENFRKKLGAKGKRNGANTHPEKNVFRTNNPGGKVFRGTHYYNNGVIELRAKECPEGFIRGGLPRK